MRLRDVIEDRVGVEAMVEVVGGIHAQTASTSLPTFSPLKSFRRFSKLTGCPAP